MTPIDNTQGETPTPITDGAVFKLPIAEIPGEEIIVKEFVGAGIARQLERRLQQAAAERDAFSKKIINLTCGIGADAKEFLSVPEMSVALLWRNYKQAEAALGEAREQWRMSSVCRELKARNAELEGALREIAAVINERGTGHVVMYSDRMTGFLPRINQLLSPPVGQPDASDPGNNKLTDANSTEA